MAQCASIVWKAQRVCYLVDVQRQGAVARSVTHNYRRQQKMSTCSEITRSCVLRWLRRMPLGLSSDKTESSKKMRLQSNSSEQKGIEPALRWLFSSQTHISSLKLGLMLSVWDRDKTLLSTCQSSGAQSTQDIYCFHFVLRRQLIAYCVPLLLPPTGANLFRLNSTVVSLMPFGKKRKGGGTYHLSDVEQETKYYQEIVWWSSKEMKHYQVDSERRRAKFLIV